MQKFIEIGKKETTVGRRKTWDFSNTKHIQLQASFTYNRHLTTVFISYALIISNIEIL